MDNSVPYSTARLRKKLLRGAARESAKTHSSCKRNRSRHFRFVSLNGTSCASRVISTCQTRLLRLSRSHAIPRYQPHAGRGLSCAVPPHRALLSARLRAHVCSGPTRPRSRPASQSLAALSRRKTTPSHAHAALERQALCHASPPAARKPRAPVPRQHGITAPKRNPHTSQETHLQRKAG
jgi:hypothetical protein